MSWLEKYVLDMEMKICKAKDVSTIGRLPNSSEVYDPI